jgi:hypothetical protein
VVQVIHEEKEFNFQTIESGNRSYIPKRWRFPNSHYSEGEYFPFFFFQWFFLAFTIIFSFSSQRMIARILFRAFLLQMEKLLISGNIFLTAITLSLEWISVLKLQQERRNGKNKNNVSLCVCFSFCFLLSVLVLALFPLKKERN